MGVEYQFTDVTKWDVLWEHTYDSPYDPNKPELILPIPEFTLPLQVSSPILAFLVEPSAFAPETWKWAGKAKFKITTGLTNINSGTPDTTLAVHSIPLKEVSIVQIPPYASSFSVSIKFFDWIDHAFLKIWEYSGNDAGTVHDKLDQVLANQGA